MPPPTPQLIRSEFENPYADPETLLRKYPLTIVISGTTTGAVAQPKDFIIECDDRTIKGFTTGSSGQLGIQKDRYKVRLSSRPAGTDNSATVLRAYSIPTAKTWGTTNSRVVDLPIDGDVRLALTSQMTGCVFSFGTGLAGHPSASHIWPSREGSRRDAQDDAARVGRAFMVGSPTQLRAGEGYDADGRASVIGFRRGRVWRFYVQRWKAIGDTHFLHSVEKLGRV